MVLRIPYENMEGKLSASIKREGTDYQSAYLVLIVGDNNLDEVLTYARNNPWVVGIEYRGDYSILKGKDIANLNVFVTYKLDNVRRVYENIAGVIEQNISQFEQTAGTDVVILIQNEECFDDMFFVDTFSAKHNVRFTGGHYLRIKNDLFGMVPNGVLPKPLPDIKIPLVIRGEGSVLPVFQWETADYALSNEVCPNKRRSKGTVVKKTVSSASKPVKKKAKSSIVGTGTVAF